MNFLNNYFGMKTRSESFYEGNVPAGTISDTPLRPPRKQTNQTRNDVFRKLPSELMRVILLESLDGKLPELAKWRLVNHQWKQFIDENIFSAHTEFVTTCMNPSPEAGNLYGAFTQGNSFSFVTGSMREFQDSDHSKDHALMRQVQIVWLLKDSAKNSSVENSGSRISAVESMNLILSAQKKPGNDQNSQLEKKITQIFHQLRNYLESKKIHVQLKGLPTDAVVQENTLRLIEAIAQTLARCVESRAGSIWFNPQTGLVEAVHGKDSSPICFDSITTTDLLDREKDGSIHFSKFTVTTPEGKKQFIIWDHCGVEINTKDWSSEAKLSLESFWKEQERLKKEKDDLEAKFSKAKRAQTGVLSFSGYDFDSYND